MENMVNELDSIASEPPTSRPTPDHLVLQIPAINGDVPPEVQSPKTPTRSYTTSDLGSSKNGLITAFVLCHWDNIIGPRISHVWKVNTDSHLSQRLLKAIAIQTLNGEICRDPLDPHIDTKFFLLRDYGVAVSAYVFSAADKEELGVHSLSLIIPSEKKNMFLSLSDLCAQWIKRIAGKLKIFLEKEPSDANILLSTHLLYFLQMLASLKQAAVPKFIPVCYMLTLSPPKLDISIIDSQALCNLYIIKLCDSHFYPEHRTDPILLRQAITAMLLTGGRATVIGHSAAPTNLMISTLAMFIPAPVRARCRYASSEDDHPYHPEVPIQGLLRDKEGQISSTLKDVTLSSFPTALVDVTRREVKISGYIHKHQVARHKALVQELDCLWKGKRYESYTTSDMFFVPDDPETIVKNFLADLDLIPPTDGLKEKFVDNFVRYLEKKALALIKLVELDVENYRKMDKIKRKKIKHEMGLQVPGDFKIVLAVADNLQSGFYSFMYSERVKEYMNYAA